MRVKILIGLVVCFLAAVIGGELFAKYVLGLGHPPLSMPHPTIEYMFQPNQDVHRFGNRYLINAYGMRSENFPKTKTDNSEIRIMAIGDSVINGGNLTDHADLATSIVGRELSKSLATKVIVGNISAGSWGPGNWLAYVREFGFFDADCVVFVMSSHDYADNPTYEPLNPYTHPTRPPFSALTEGLSRYLPRYIPFLSATLEEPDRPVLGEDVHKGLADLKAVLETAQTRAGKVMVFLHLEQCEIENQKIFEGHYRITALCQELGIPVVSLESYFKKAIDSGIRPYRDNIHPNIEGQKAIASALLENLPVTELAKGKRSRNSVARKTNGSSGNI